MNNDQIDFSTDKQEESCSVSNNGSPQNSKFQMSFIKFKMYIILPRQSLLIQSESVPNL